MKKYITLAVLLLCLSMTAMAETKTINLKVIETSDVHGHFFPYDFIGQKPLKGTLARVNTYVQRQRKDFGEQLLLIDNGDIMQGQPCVYWSNYVMPDDENLSASIINYMNYDAETVGNHDIETGHGVYDKWIREVRCPLLGANIVNKQTGNPYVHPYAIIYRQGVKIAILGMITPTIASWLNESVWSGLEFTEMTACAKKWVEYIKTYEQPDLIFGLFHSGLEGGIVDDHHLEENATARVAKEVPGFDIIFFGHDHQVHNEWIRCESNKKDVLCLDPSCYALNVAEADIQLTYVNGKLKKKDIKGNIVSVSDEQIDEQLVSHFQPKIDEIKKYVERPIGKFENSITTRDCYFGNSAFNDFIHNLQLQITKADISFSAPLSFNSTIEAGTVTVADMFKLYRFENLLFVLNMKGEEIRKLLEMSYDMWANTMKSKDDHLVQLNDAARGDQQRSGFKNYTFNFDSAAGIDYEVDVTKPDGQKVHILRMSNGESFDEAKWYKVVMNSYRANGGGELLTLGAGIPKDSINGRIIYQSKLDQRYYLMKEIEKMGTVAPKANNNWRFVPEEWTKEAAKRDRMTIFGRED